jgi:hypothetical protein
MPVLLIILSFISGLLICNAVPHLAAGLRGEAFPSPFAKPPGRGLSAPTTNVVWGWINLFVGLAIMPRFVLFAPVMPLFNLAWIAFALGFLLAGLIVGRHFGRVRGAAP